MKNIYVLYRGTSEDGRGRGNYIGWTFDKKLAEQIRDEYANNPYSTNHVTVYKQDEYLKELPKV